MIRTEDGTISVRLIEIGMTHQRIVTSRNESVQFVKEDHTWRGCSCTSEDLSNGSFAFSNILRFVSVVPLLSQNLYLVEQFWPLDTDEVGSTLVRDGLGQ